MPATTFTWFPEYGARLSQKPKVTVTQFGDGYEQRKANGINHQPESWTLEFSSSSASLPAALAFVRARGGLQAFNWTTPFGETRVFVCRGWNATRNQGYYTTTFEFEEVFES